MMAPCAYLYVPGHRPDRFDKALGSGADAIILDLEDAVPVGAKDAARDDVRTFLTELTSSAVQTWVRINDGDRGRDDLRALSNIAALSGIVIPKANPDTLATLHAQAPRIALLPLIESASAVTDATAIGRADGVRTLAIGEVDLAADLGLGDAVPDAALWALRMQVVVASAAAQRAAPLGPVVRDIDDLERVEALARQLRHAGFGAMQTIHPNQVPIVKAVFTPTADEFAAAQRTLQQAEHANSGVFVGDDGRMIDEAVLRSARRLLDRP
jgi:citrate lyase subunit beta/citryl-CoA lyase